MSTSFVDTAQRATSASGAPTYLLLPVPRLSIMSTSNVWLMDANPYTNGAAMDVSLHDGTPEPPGSIQSRSPRPGESRNVRRTNTVRLPEAGAE